MARHRNRIVRLLSGAGLVAGLVAGAGATELERGRLLYETKCIACHESRLHIRDQRKVDSWADLRAWVGRWAGQAAPGWEEEEIEAVVRYLNAYYYEFPPEGEAQR